MLTFFRRIRKGLLDGGRTSKPASPAGRYVLYAVGEIALVVIGILIALQINNWNEWRKDAKIEREYLFALRDEFEENLLNLKENEEINRRVMIGMRNMLSLTGPSPSSSDVPKFNLYWVQIMSEIANYEPSQSVLDDLISSGNLSKVTNIHLRRLISKSKASLNRLNRQEMAVRDLRSEVIQLLNENAPIRSLLSNGLNIEESKFEVSANAALSDPKFENLLSYCLRYATTLEEKRYQEMEVILAQIVELIKDELGSAE